jgi:hypothetical protein
MPESNKADPQPVRIAAPSAAMVLERHAVDHETLGSTVREILHYIRDARSDAPMATAGQELANVILERQKAISAKMRTMASSESRHGPPRRPPRRPPGGHRHVSLHPRRQQAIHQHWRSQVAECPSIEGVSGLTGHELSVYPPEAHPQVSSKQNVYFDDSPTRLEVSYDCSLSADVERQFIWEHGPTATLDMVALLAFEFPSPMCDATLSYDLTWSGLVHVRFASLATTSSFIPKGRWKMSVAVFADAEGALDDAYPAIDDFIPIWTTSGGNVMFGSGEVNTTIPLGILSSSGEFEVKGGVTSRLFVALRAALTAHGSSVGMMPSLNYLELLPPDESSSAPGVSYFLHGPVTRYAGREPPSPRHP